jgi:hypothetical protein
MYVWFIPFPKSLIPEYNIVTRDCSRGLDWYLDLLNIYKSVPVIITLSLRVRGRVTVTLTLAVYRQSVLLGDKPLRLTSSFFRLNKRPTSCDHSSYVTSLSQSQSQSYSYVTTDGQSASVSSNKAPIWGLWTDFCYCQTVFGSFSGPSPVGLATLFTVSDSRLPFSLPPTTRRVTVEVSTPPPHGTSVTSLLPEFSLYNVGTDRTENIASNNWFVFVAAETCVSSRYHATPTLPAAMSQYVILRENKYLNYFRN